MNKKQTANADRNNSLYDSTHPSGPDSRKNLAPIVNDEPTFIIYADKDWAVPALRLLQSIYGIHEDVIAWFIWWRREFLCYIRDSKLREEWMNEIGDDLALKKLTLPSFTIRAKDNFSLSALNLVFIFVPCEGPDNYNNVLDVINTFANWRTANPTLCSDPD